MFFSFEGIDGSGKTTQARLLAAALRDDGHDVVEVREPGGTLLGETIRALLLDPASSIDARAELLLFSAARAQLVVEVVRPALERGAVVIADRFFDSSTAYQGGGRGLNNTGALALNSLHHLATGGTVPAMTFLIDVPLAVASERRGSRDADRMESGGERFYERVRNAYLHLASSAPDRITIIDGTMTAEQIQSKVARLAKTAIKRA